MPAPIPGGYGHQAGPPKTNPLAIVSLVCSIAGLLCFGVILGVVGAVLGFVAGRQIQQSGGAQKGAGLAKAGLIIGIVAFALSVILLIAGVSGAIRVPSS